MEMSEEQHWEVLAALFEHGADAKAVATELSNPGPGNIEHYIKCSRISAKRVRETYVHRYTYKVLSLSLSSIFFSISFVPFLINPSLTFLSLSFSCNSDPFLSLLCEH